MSVGVTPTTHVEAFPPVHAGLPDGYDTWDDLYDDLAAWRDEEAARGLKAMRLAPTRAVYRALLKGQPVPADCLDPVWARRYGL